MRITLLSFGVVCWACGAISANDWGLKSGKAALESSGPMAFGPDGVLFIGDSKSATIWAIDTVDTKRSENEKINIDKVGQKIAGLLGTTSDDILIDDMVINPASGQAYFAVSRGRGPDATPVILRVGSDGVFSEVDLSNIKFAKAELPNAPEPGGTGRRNRRAQSITDIAYIDGRIIVAGLSNEKFASNLRSIPFPFESVSGGTSVEIYHGAHGQYETRSPVRTFVPLTIDNEPHVLAAYTCTPLVKFPVKQLTPNEKVVGTTIAELGNRNRPLDMIVYEKGGQGYLLLSNSSRGIMKIPTAKFGGADGIDSRVPRGETAGVGYETIKDLSGVVQLDKLNESHATILVQNEDVMNVQTIPLP